VATSDKIAAMKEQAIRLGLGQLTQLEKLHVSNKNRPAAAGVKPTLQAKNSKFEFAKIEDNGSFDWTQCSSEVSNLLSITLLSYAYLTDDPCSRPQGEEKNCGLCKDGDTGALPCHEIKKTFNFGTCTATAGMTR